MWFSHPPCFLKEGENKWRQLHSSVKRQNCGAAGIAVDEVRVDRKFRRVPFGHEWVGRKQAVKTCG